MQISNSLHSSSISLESGHMKRQNLLQHQHQASIESSLSSPVVQKIPCSQLPTSGRLKVGTGSTLRGRKSLRTLRKNTAAPVANCRMETLLEGYFGENDLLEDCDFYKYVLQPSQDEYLDYNYGETKDSADSFARSIQNRHQQQHQQSISTVPAIQAGQTASTWPNQILQASRGSSGSGSQSHQHPQQQQQQQRHPGSANSSTTSNQTTIQNQSSPNSIAAIANPGPGDHLGQEVNNGPLSNQLPLESARTPRSFVNRGPMLLQGPLDSTPFAGVISPIQQADFTVSSNKTTAMNTNNTTKSTAAQAVAATAATISRGPALVANDDQNIQFNSDDAGKPVSNDESETLQQKSPIKKVVVPIITESEKKRQRRANNRLAAAKCRKKKTETITFLTEQNEKLRSNMNQLHQIFLKIFTHRNLLIEELHNCKSRFNYMPPANIDEIISDYDSGVENISVVSQLVEYANNSPRQPQGQLLSPYLNSTPIQQHQQYQNHIHHHTNSVQAVVHNCGPTSSSPSPSSLIAAAAAAGGGGGGGINGVAQVGTNNVQKLFPQVQNDPQMAARVAMNLSQMHRYQEDTSMQLDY